MNICTKCVIFFLLLLFCGLNYSPVHAQKFYAGVKGGVQYNNTVFSNKEFSAGLNSVPVPGFNLGGIMDYPIYKFYSFQMELNYTNKGRNLEYERGPLLRNRSSYHFMEMPLLLRVNVKHKYINYYANVGPNLSYWMAGHGTLYGRMPFESGEKSKSYRMAFGEESGSYSLMMVNKANRLHLGLDAGLGMVFQTDLKKFVMIELRYSMGHTHLAGKESGNFGSREVNENLEAYNRTISLNVAYIHNFNLWESFRKGRTTMSLKQGSRKIKK